MTAPNPDRRAEAEALARQLVADRAADRWTAPLPVEAILDDELRPLLCGALMDLCMELTRVALFAESQGGAAVPPQPGAGAALAEGAAIDPAGAVLAVEVLADGAAGLARWLAATSDTTPDRVLDFATATA